MVVFGISMISSSSVISNSIHSLLHLNSDSFALKLSKNLSAQSSDTVTLIETVASFMLTLPTESYEDTWETVRFGLELDPDYVYWLTFVPYPGNDLSDLAHKTGTIINDDPTTYNVFNEIVYVPEGRSVEEIRKTVAKAYRKFYLRPKYMIRQLNKLIHLPPSKSWNLIRSGFRMFLKNKV